MDKEEKKPINDKNEPLSGEGDALLEILTEKDNLIVSLKESSTKRDKLNEKQIRLLSEDNTRKSSKLKTLESDVKVLAASVKQKEAEAKLYQDAESKLTVKIEEVRTAFERYKTNIHSALKNIKESIAEEFSKREKYKEDLLENMQENILKLEKLLIFQINITDYRIINKIAIIS